MGRRRGARHNERMLDLRELKAEDLKGLDPSQVAALAQQMLAHIHAQDAHIGEQARGIQERDQRIENQARDLKYKQAKLEKVTFELARLKAWRFSARTEAMNAEQRQMFEEALAEDQADLEAQLEELKAQLPDKPPAKEPPPKRQPKRQALPAHLRRVEHRHEPDSTVCGCGRQMERVGEDVSEKLDIIPAEFFVHRHIRGKWACRCCNALVQEPAEPSVIDKGIAAPGFIAHTMVSRFVDHLPYYRQETINARSRVHTPRSTLAAMAGGTSATVAPLLQAHKAFVLSCAVLHADETPVAMLDPGAGKTKRAYVWAYSRGAFDPYPGVIYDFRVSRAGRHPQEFLKKWSGTLVVDDFSGYDGLLKLEGRIEAGCLAHCRRRFDELVKFKGSPVAEEALQRIATLYKIERGVAELSNESRLAIRQQLAKPHWDELHVWLLLQRQQVPDGTKIAKAIDYTLRRWEALTRCLHDGAVAIDNNHIENLIRPWALGRKSWLFAGSEMGGERAAAMMSLLQSAKLNGHEPWAYFKDVLTRLPTHPNSRIEELLPHRWQPQG
jgi:transposase